MNGHIVVLWILSFLLGFPHTNNKIEIKNPTAGESLASYSGPIIDMHIHAFDDESSFNAMLGREMDLAMNGKTYIASTSMEKLIDLIFYYT